MNVFGFRGTRRTQGDSGQRSSEASLRQFQGLKGKDMIREKRPKKALEELGGPPYVFGSPLKPLFSYPGFPLEPLELHRTSLRDKKTEEPSSDLAPPGSF